MKIRYNGNFWWNIFNKKTQFDDKELSYLICSAQSWSIDWQELFPLELMSRNTSQTPSECWKGGGNCDHRLLDLHGASFTLLGRSIWFWKSNLCSRSSQSKNDCPVQTKLEGAVHNVHYLHKLQSLSFSNNNCVLGNNILSRSAGIDRSAQRLLEVNNTYKLDSLGTPLGGDLFHQILNHKWRQLQLTAGQQLARRMPRTTLRSLEVMKQIPQGQF